MDYDDNYEMSTETRSKNTESFRDMVNVNELDDRTRDSFSDVRDIVRGSVDIRKFPKYRTDVSAKLQLFDKLLTQMASERNALVERLNKIQNDKDFKTILETYGTVSKQDWETALSLVSLDTQRIIPYYVVMLMLAYDGFKESSSLVNTEKTVEESNYIIKQIETMINSNAEQNKTRNAETKAIIECVINDAKNRNDRLLEEYESKLNKHTEQIVELKGMINALRSMQNITERPKDIFKSLDDERPEQKPPKTQEPPKSVVVPETGTTETKTIEPSTAAQHESVKTSRIEAIQKFMSEWYESKGNLRGLKNAVSEQFSPNKDERFLIKNYIEALNVRKAEEMVRR